MNSGTKVRVLVRLGSWMLMGLSACTSTSPLKASSTESPGTAMLDSLGSYKDKALETMGLKKPEMSELPEAYLPDRKVSWRLHASESLNITPSGASVALLARLYKLRSPEAFMQAPYEVFGDPAREKAQLGDDILETRDVQLIPGQHTEVLDKVAREARYVGIVSLFRSPSPQRWRYAFSSESAWKTGLSVGLHACAMSVQVGDPIGQRLSIARSAAVTCP